MLDVAVTPDPGLILISRDSYIFKTYHLETDKMFLRGPRTKVVFLTVTVMDRLSHKTRGTETMRASMLNCYIELGMKVNPHTL